MSHVRGNFFGADFGLGTGTARVRERLRSRGHGIAGK